MYTFLNFNTQVAYRSPGDLPTHRMLLHINKKLTAEERSIITNEWGHCLDSHGYVRPDFVLHWFNKGIDIFRINSTLVGLLVCQLKMYE